MPVVIRECPYCEGTTRVAAASDDPFVIMDKAMDDGADPVEALFREAEEETEKQHETTNFTCTVCGGRGYIVEDLEK